MVKGSCLNSHVRFYSRKAFTMIELIFAIVIISVVMLTIPTMIQVNNKALEGNVAQEAIFLVSSVLSESTTLIWDDNSLGGTASDVVLSKILDVPPGDASYDRFTDVNSTIRAGGLREDLHRSFFDYNASNPDQQPALASNASETLGHDINNSITAPLGYKFGYTIDVTRQYVSDTPHAGTAADPFIFYAPTSLQNQSNIKMTTVTIDANTTEGIVPIARLRAYTCNIGEIDYAKRRF
jgi:prepilin-type N-terminal cleavage/methylation domain-containing protein